MTANDIITHDIDGAVIAQRETDGYLNASAMCKAAGKLFGHYRENKQTMAYLEELAGSIGIPIDRLVVTIMDGANDLRGTWVHPYVAIHLAQWLSPRFAVQVSKWVYNWTVDLRHAAGELNRRVDEWIAQGRTQEWIRERVDGLMTRKELTDWWHSDGLLGRSHFGILTRLLQMRSVGLGPKELRELKGLSKSHSLRGTTARRLSFCSSAWASGPRWRLRGPTKRAATISRRMLHWLAAISPRPLGCSLRRQLANRWRRPRTSSRGRRRPCRRLRVRASDGKLRKRLDGRGASLASCPPRRAASAVLAAA